MIDFGCLPWRLIDESLIRYLFWELGQDVIIIVEDKTKKLSHQIGADPLSTEYELCSKLVLEDFLVRKRLMR